MPPETPQNGEYLLAAYGVTVVIVVGYFWSLFRRSRKVLKSN